MGIIIEGHEPSKIQEESKTIFWNLFIFYFYSFYLLIVKVLWFSSDKN